jgi:hypothetical protein
LGGDIPCKRPTSYPRSSTDDDDGLCKHIEHVLTTSTRDCIEYNPNLNAEHVRELKELKGFVAQRLGIPKKKVVPAEFREANSRKYTYMIAVTFDTRLRPIEIGWVKFRACTSKTTNRTSRKTELRRTRHGTASLSAGR